MITVEGAKLLAAFIPVLILILAVERRMLGPEPQPFRLLPKIWWWAKGIGQTFGAALALISMAPLIISVNANQNVEGGYAIAAIVSVLLTGQAVVGIVTSLVFRGYFGHEQTELGEERLRLKAEHADYLRRTRLARKPAKKRIDRRWGGGVTPDRATPTPGGVSTSLRIRVRKPRRG